MKLQSCINYLLTVTQHSVSRLFTERLAVFGITPGQYGVLYCLWEKGSCTPKEITQALYLESSTISGILDRMQRQGLIQRTTDPEDRRSVVVVATPAGMELEPAVMEVITELNEELMGQFTAGEREALLTGLCRLANIDTGGL